jgi:hypothetical protein
MPMPGMGTPAGAPAGFPALAVILALFLLGSVMWTTDELAALARVTTSPAAPGRSPQQRELATVPPADHPASTTSTAQSTGTPQLDPPPGSH